MRDTFDFPEPPERAFTGLPLIVDSFAGGGGASTGIEAALGRGPDIAINHNPAALALHAANHPETLHLSENVYRVDPLDHLAGRHIGLMWFSPDCKHFSKAKGGKPVARNIRDLAWIIPGWIERIQKSGGRVDVVIMENVEEFAGWGPLIETERGLMPCPDRKGETFEAWCKAIRRLGGKLDRRELRACDYGAPTIRRRLFVVIRFDGLPIVWPEETHAPAEVDENGSVLSWRTAPARADMQPWRTAAECIDWTLPCPSIFDSKAEIWAQHGLRAVRPLAQNTLARVAKGLRRYVIDAERPFLVNLTHGGRTEDLADPMRTITGAHRGEKAIVVPSIVGCGGRAGQSRPRSAAEPFATVTAKADACLITPSLVSIAHGDSGGRREYPVTEPYGVVTAGGISHAVVAPTLVNVANSKTTGRAPNTWPMTEPLRTITTAPGQAVAAPVLMRHFGASVAADISAPAPTIVAGGGGKTALVAPLMATMRNSQKPWQGVDEPAHTVTAGGAGLSLISPALATYYGHGEGRGTRAGTLTEPLRTVTTENRHALLAPALASLKGTARRMMPVTGPHPTICAEGNHSAVIAPVLTYAQQGGACRPIEAPHHTICASPKDQNSMIAATMVHVGNGERAGQAPRALDITAPLNTIVAGGVKQYPVAAFLAQQNNDSRCIGGVNPGRPADAPMSTITSTGSHQNPVAAWIAKYYGTGDGARTDEPMHTLTTRDRMGHTEAQLAAPPFDESHAPRARQVAELLRTHGLWDDREFVTVEIGGASFVIVDVGMRMLTPRELFNAQGFPPDYVIEGVWHERDGDWTFEAFPKDVQVSCVGNSVCPPVAEALVRANCAHLAAQPQRDEVAA